MSPKPTLLALLLVAATALVLGACGGSAPKGSGAPAPPASFPASRGKTIADLRRGLAEGPIVAPTVSDLHPGSNRYGFGLFDASRRQVTGAPVALYIERSGTATVTGPFVAREESLAVAPPFQSETVAKDPGAAKSVYVTDIRFPAPGTYAVQGLTRIGGHLQATSPMPAIVAPADPVPRVGQFAPRVSTPTLASAGGNVASIDTRVPPDTMHSTSLTDALGRSPVMLLFATPALCQSRVCGPVVDIAEQVKSQGGAGAVFIHTEIYLDNMIKQGCLEGKRPQSQCVRPQVVAYHLPTEPWLFAIDRHGRIVARIEGAYSLAEFRAALKVARAG